MATVMRSATILNDSTDLLAATEPQSVGHIAPDCSGLNFYDIDPSFQTALAVNVDPKILQHFESHIRRLGERAGGKLDELARLVEKNPPQLQHRDKFGRDLDNIIYHPAYREMEKIGFEEFQMHAMCHREGAFGWNGTAPQIMKYAFQYLFAQSEFGMMCPLSITDATIHVLRTFASDELKAKLLPRMTATNLDDLWKGTQWMTERAGGSDVGTLETVARNEAGVWRLYGDKWFASHTDAHIALILARPEGAPAGTAGIAMFALPRYLADGSRNKYRIVRIKDKMGTKSLASCEVVLEGAEAYLVGKLDQGLKQMMEQVNMSRLSHGVRAAGMMRRSFNEAMQVAKNRYAFGDLILNYPLLQRQIIKILIPAEQALSLSMIAASSMDRAKAGDRDAAQIVRILTPLVKFRACRDAIAAARASMETRGGNGYIEDWVNSKIVRDAHIGVLWEGTSNINAIDVIRRAVLKAKAHTALRALLVEKLDGSKLLPDTYRDRLFKALERVFAFVERVAADSTQERMYRQATTALYNVASAITTAWEGLQPKGSPAKLLISRFVLEHRVEPIDPLSPPGGEWERQAYPILLGQSKISIDKAAALLDIRA